jgi:hypothetical protein
MIKIRRRLGELGDEVHLTDFDTLSDLVDHARRPRDNVLDRLADALARECGLTGQESRPSAGQ